MSLRPIPCLRAVAVALGLLHSFCADARLGGDEASIALDATRLSTFTSRQVIGNLVRVDMTVGRGVVHQYLGPAGQVFALSFSGGRTPPLDILLGDYARTFIDAAQSDHRHAHVDTPTLKGSLAGRPGAISGLIWLPPLVPAGVNPEALP